MNDSTDDGLPVTLVGQGTRAPPSRAEHDQIADCPLDYGRSAAGWHFRILTRDGMSRWSAPFATLELLEERVQENAREAQEVAARWAEEDARDPFAKTLNKIEPGSWCFGNAMHAHGFYEYKISYGQSDLGWHHRIQYDEYRGDVLACWSEPFATKDEAVSDAEEQTAWIWESDDYECWERQQIAAFARNQLNDEESSATEP